MVRWMPGARPRATRSLCLALVVSLSLHAAALAALVQLFGTPPSGARAGSGGRDGEAGQDGRAGAGIVLVELIGNANAEAESARAATADLAAQTSAPRAEPAPKPRLEQHMAFVPVRPPSQPDRHESEPTATTPAWQAIEPAATVAAPVAERTPQLAQTAARAPSGRSSGSAEPGDGAEASGAGAAAAPGGASSDGPLSRVARPASAIRPRYPEAARERGDEAEVIVEAWIAASGRVERARIRTSAGREFDAAALEAVEQARFYPASRGGRPVASAVAMRLHFEVEP